jgi:hypothetical protein
MDDITDFTYVVMILMSVYGIGLFGYEIYWKLKHEGKPSPIFVAVFFLMAAILFDKSISLYARGLIGIEPEYHNLLESNVWAMKNWLTILSIGYILITLTRRLFSNGLHQHRSSDGTGVCRGAGDTIVHTMNGEMIYYRCSKCGKEWKKGEAGFEKAKFDSENR